MLNRQTIPFSGPGPVRKVQYLSLAHRLLLIFLVAIASEPRAETAPADDLPGLPRLETPAREAMAPAIEITPAPASPPAQELGNELPPLTTIDLTAPTDDLWQRLRNGFGMPDLNSPLVAERQAWYLNRPEMLQRIFERSRKYIYHIVVELEKRGMPTELALLPIVESSFNPLAYSSARALGMWQFIPSTGKSYKLKQNWWLDERRDIIASTSAALDYLQTIYEMHGDWHLALASYNWGEHAVARAIAKNAAKGLPTDYANLGMPGETRYYVPKLQAIKNIVAHPEVFGFRLDPIPNKPYFGTVDMVADADIVTVARLAETPLAEFVALNPAYQRPVIPGDSKSPLVIPADKMQAFQDNLARHAAQEKPLSTWHTYRLKKGEKIEAVAARFRLSVARLKQLNGITPRTKIVVGQSFLIPAIGSSANPDLLAAVLPKTPVDPPKKKRGGKRKSFGKGGHQKHAAQPVKKSSPSKPKRKH
ncbi:MAG: transglycosylase SLT domain-containing protein [Rhodocyclales bacterium]|nr:transglycosylase SLT domain-containing protein [Rhodocyclales bacterium]